MELYGGCIMTSHGHLIIGSHGEKLEDIMRDMKRHTSEKLRAAIQRLPGESRKEWLLELMGRAGTANSNNSGFQLWQQDNHPIELTTPERKHQRLDYIHRNPVLAGIVEKSEEYTFSSAKDYYGGKGLIELLPIDPIIK